MPAREERGGHADGKVIMRVTTGHPPAGTAARAGLLWDIALPLIAYYALHGLGFSDWAALLAATAAASVRLVAVAVWSRQVSWFSADTTGAGDTFCGFFLASLAGRRPLTLAAAQASQPARADALRVLYDTEPAGRRAFRLSALVWGLGLLGESLVRVPLVYLLPVEVMVGLSTALMVAAMAALAVWNIVFMLRAARRHPELGVLLPGGMRP